MDIKHYSSELHKKKISSVELTEEYLKRIEATEPEINAYITVTADLAREAARQSDARRQRGESLGRLDGIPFALKDNFLLEGVITTCGSRFLENYVSPYSSTVADKLLSGGGVLLGKTNMDEFAMGSNTDTSYFGKTRNPLNTELSPGGSSGGSAAVVAADTAVFSIGSDTGGSVRLPAAYCGNIGLKPTYGRISRYGMISLASSLDTVGLFTKSVSDCAFLFSLLSGKDEKDATSLSHPPHITRRSGIDLCGIRIGVVRELCDNADTYIRAELDRAIQKFSELGAELEYISIPTVSLGAECYAIICAAEAASNLSRFDGIRFGRQAKGCSDIKEIYTKSRSEGFGDLVKRRIILGNFVLSDKFYEKYYGKSQLLRRAMTEEILRLFADYDLLLSPTALTLPNSLDKKRRLQGDCATDSCTCVGNLVGVPAISLPVKRDGIPCGAGIQLMANRLREDILFYASSLYLEEE